MRDEPSRTNGGVPAVTILMTVRNVESTFVGCLEALRAQDYAGDTEIVVIDAESNDSTPRILRDFAETYPRLTVVTRACSQPEAFNLAIDSNLISGEIVAMLDGDCIPESDWLTSLIRHFTPEWDAVGGIGLTPGDANFLAKVIGFDLDYRFRSTPDGQVLRHPNMNLAVRADVFRRIRFDPTLEVGYDTDFGYRLTAAGFRIRYTKSAVVVHYHRSTISGYVRQQFKSAKFAVQVYRKQPQGLSGDNINPPWMLAQPALAFAIAVAAVASIVWAPAMTIAVAGAVGMVLLLLVISGIVAVRLREPTAAIALPFLYAVRLPAWTWGILVGIWKFSKLAVLPTVGGR